MKNYWCLWLSSPHIHPLDPLVWPPTTLPKLLCHLYCQIQRPWFIVLELLEALNIADHTLRVLWHWPADSPFPPLQVPLESGFLSYLLTAPGNYHSFSPLFFCLYFISWKSSPVLILSYLLAVSGKASYLASLYLTILISKLEILFDVSNEFALWEHVKQYPSHGKSFVISHDHYLSLYHT